MVLDTNQSIVMITLAAMGLTGQIVAMTPYKWSKAAGNLITAVSKSSAAKKVVASVINKGAGNYGAATNSTVPESTPIEKGIDKVVEVVNKYKDKKKFGPRR